MHLGVQNFLLCCHFLFLFCLDVGINCNEQSRYFSASKIVCHYGRLLILVRSHSLAQEFPDEFKAPNESLNKILEIDQGIKVNCKKQKIATEPQTRFE